jgi:hypothetical protein
MQWAQAQRVGNGSLNWIINSINAGPVFRAGDGLFQQCLPWLLIPLLLPAARVVSSLWKLLCWLLCPSFHLLCPFVRCFEVAAFIASSFKDTVAQSRHCLPVSFTVLSCFDFFLLCLALFSLCFLLPFHLFTRRVSSPLKLKIPLTIKNSLNLNVVALSRTSHSSSNQPLSHCLFTPSTTRDSSQQLQQRTLNR